MAGKIQGLSTNVIELFMIYLILSNSIGILNNWNIAINEKWRALYKSWERNEAYHEDHMATFGTQCFAVCQLQKFELS